MPTDPFGPLHNHSAIGRRTHSRTGISSVFNCEQSDVVRSRRYGRNAAPLKKYGARFLVRNGACEVHGGALQRRRHVVIEFESYAVAKACHDLPEYQAAAKICDEASTADFVIIEGHED